MKVRHAVLIALLSASVAASTTVTQTVRDPGGNLASGTVSFRITAACSSPDGSYVGDQVVISTFTGGAFSVSLTPNDTCVPARTAYAVSWRLSDGTVRSEVWVVPTSGTPLAIRDVVSSTTPLPAYLVQWQQLAQNGATLGQIPAWTGSSWQPRSIAMRYVAPVSGTVFLIPSGISGLGPNPAFVGCYDPSGNAYQPGGVNVDSSGNITVTSAVAMTGACVFSGAPSSAPGQYVVTLAGTTVTVLAATHALGALAVVSACYDGSGNWFEPGAVSVDSSGDVTISSLNSMTGRCILQ